MNRIEKTLAKAKEEVKNELAVAKSIVREEKKKLRAAATKREKKELKHEIATLNDGIEVLSAQREVIDEALHKKHPPGEGG